MSAACYPALRLLLGAGLLAGALAAGCRSDGVDPPPNGEFTTGEEAPQVDSLVSWARQAREAWASGDTTRAAAGDEKARATFAGVWSDLVDAADDADVARDTEHLPRTSDAPLPTVEGMRDRLVGLGLSATISAAGGPSPLWQVVIEDPTGRADASTEFWAWPDPETPLGPPVIQPLPPGAPARARFGPDAVGDLVTYARTGGLGLASAWTRPRGASGLEVALVERPTTGGRKARWKVVSNRVLPLVADSVLFVPTQGAPELIVKGQGAVDRLFDECPTCPHVERRQRYLFVDGTWSLREEVRDVTPYSIIVAFMHALHEGGPDAALPYAAGPEVLLQASELGLDRGPVGRFHAAPGTDAMDPTQRFRRGGTGGADGLEITVEPRGDRWVVADLRPTRLVIE